jgi:hypothetical protein
VVITTLRQPIESTLRKFLHSSAGIGQCALGIFEIRRRRLSELPRAFDIIAPGVQFDLSLCERVFRGIEPCGGVAKRLCRTLRLFAFLGEQFLGATQLTASRRGELDARVGCRRFLRPDLRWAWRRCRSC